MKEDGWTSNLVIHKECPYNKDVVLFINECDMNKILRLESEYSNVEFSVYFNIKEHQNGDIKGHIISELIVPEQIVSVGAVEYENNIHSDGVLHKHPSGMNSFSTTDEEYINANHNLSLLLVNKEFKAGVSRIKTPCGCLMTSGVDVQILVEENEELDKFIEDAKTKIKRYEPKQVTFMSVQDTSGWKPNVECSDCGKIIRKKEYTECVHCGQPYCKKCKDKLEYCYFCLDGQADCYVDKYRDEIKYFD